MFQPKLVVLAIVSFVLTFVGSVSAQEKFIGSNGHVYEFVKATDILWEDANDMAQTSNLDGVSGHLATITSRGEDQDLEIWRQDVMQRFGFFNTNHQQFWVGGYQEPNQSLTHYGWSWVNNEGTIPRFNGGSSYANWQIDQPDDCGAEGCGSLGRENNDENYLAVGLLGKPGWNDQTFIFDMFAGYIIEYDFDIPQTNKILVYENDFENPIGAEWSNRTRNITPIGARRFLGRLGNATVSLTLNDLPLHEQVIVSFDVFLIHSWDGNATKNFEGTLVGPDIWKCQVRDEPILLNTTFSNVDFFDLLNKQAYPGEFPTGDFPARTGAIENNTLGYTFYFLEDNQIHALDSVYHFSFPFSHTDSSVAIEFIAAGLQEINDESWGLDNVKVELITENQPPQITHTPITSAIQNKDIKVNFEAKDVDGNLSSVELFYRITGVVDYQGVGMSPDPDQTQFTLEIPANAVTLAGVDYYIEAKDAEGATTTTPVYHVKVVDKWPVIVIPGIMGSELYDESTDPNEKVWLNVSWLLGSDPWLLRLLLQTDGIHHDFNDRCPSDYNAICNDPKKDCNTFFSCVIGGRPLGVGELISVPKFRAYENLVSYLEKDESQNGGGYKEGANLFTLPYDWRYDLHGDLNGNNPNATVHKLRAKIDTITNSRGGKVDIIAHSQGGLVIRSYIQQYKNDHKVRKVIFLGTPHLGSAKAYCNLKDYEEIITWLGNNITGLNISTQNFVCQNFPSVYQLLPRQNFITRQDEEEPYTLTYVGLSNQGLVTIANNFHAFLNTTYPSDIQYYGINGSGFRTLSGINILQNGCKSPELDVGGDGTVTHESSEGFDNAQYFYAKVDHASMPGDEFVQKKILAILNDRQNDDVPGIQNQPFLGSAGKKFTGCCPINIKISDGLGNILGIDSDGQKKIEVPESDFYTFGENQAGFFPKEGIYSIEISATGTGRFTFTIEDIEPDGTISNTTSYADIPIYITSKAKIEIEPGHASALSLDVNGNGDNDFNIEPGAKPPEELEALFAERGDINHDKELDVSDVVNILGYLFMGEKANCIPAGYVNSDNQMDVSDAVYLLSYLFLGTQKKPVGIVYCP